jgi:hypothetical protein
MLRERELLFRLSYLLLYEDEIRSVEGPGAMKWELVVLRYEFDNEPVVYRLTLGLFPIHLSVPDGMPDVA